MKVRKILEILREEKINVIRKINTTLEMRRKYRVWQYIFEKLNISFFEVEEEIFEAVKSLKEGKYATWETKCNRREGEKFSKFIVNTEGNGIKITYQYKYVSEDVTPDDWGDDYGVGLGIRKEVSPRFESVLKPVLISIEEVENTPLQSEEFVYIPNYYFDKKPNKPSLNKLKKIEELIENLRKLPEEENLYYKTDINIDSNNDSNNPENGVILTIEFDPDDLFYYKVDLKNPEDWEGADYLDLPEEMRENLKIAERVGNEIVETIESGMLPDANKIIQKEIEKINIEKEKEKLIEKGQRLADESVIEEIDISYKTRMKELLIGQKLRRKLSFKGTVIDKGEEITENTKIESLLPVFLYPEEYISDTEVIEQVQHLQKEKTRKFEEYYINLALQEK